MSNPTPHVDAVGPDAGGADAGGADAGGADVSGPDVRGSDTGGPDARAAATASNLVEFVTVGAPLEGGAGWAAVNDVGQPCVVPTHALRDLRFVRSGQRLRVHLVDAAIVRAEIP